jgi:hypothetical protein
MVSIEGSAVCICICLKSLILTYIELLREVNLPSNKDGLEICKQIKVLGMYLVILAFCPLN